MTKPKVTIVRQPGMIDDAEIIALYKTAGMDVEVIDIADMYRMPDASIASMLKATENIDSIVFHRESLSRQEVSDRFYGKSVPEMMADVQKAFDEAPVPDDISWQPWNREMLENLVKNGWRTIENVRFIQSPPDLEIAVKPNKPWYRQGENKKW